MSKKCRNVKIEFNSGLGLLNMEQELTNNTAIYTSKLVYLGDWSDHN